MSEVLTACGVACDRQHTEHEHHNTNLSLAEALADDGWLGHDEPLTHDDLACIETIAHRWYAERLAGDDVRRAAAEAMEDAAIRYLGRDLGTVHRDDIADAALAAVRDAVGGES